MTILDASFAGIAIAVLASIAITDCRAMRISPPATALLASTGLAWHATTPSHLGMVSLVWWMPALGLAAGIAIPATMILAAQIARRPWPLMPGDACLLGGIGAATGPLGLAWSIVAGAACTMLYRLHLQGRRKRPFARGYVPLAPGMAAGAAIVIAWIASGAALADDHVDAGTQGERLVAVVLGPAVDPGPPGADEHVTSLAASEPLTLPEAAARLAALTFMAVEVEDRPSRTGIVHPLATPAPQRFDLKGSLVEILDRLAALYRYRWEWRGNTVVFYRYADAEFAASTEPGPEERQVRWIIDTDRDASLAEVLERWSGEAGWSLVWSSDTDYRLGADAVFEGSFLGAVDALLADPVTHATLTATAYQANRRLVIEEAP